MLDENLVILVCIARYIFNFKKSIVPFGRTQQNWTQLLISFLGSGSVQNVYKAYGVKR